MKRLVGLVLVLLTVLFLSSQSFAQDQPLSAAESAAELRVRLAEVQAREADLQTQLNQLDEALKPENIERSLAGMGSTRPEELREQRRRQLTIEKDGVRRQLDLLTTGRARLESAIQNADNLAYQQSAQGFFANNISVAKRGYIKHPRIVLGSLTFLGLVGIVSLVAFIRRR